MDFNSQRSGARNVSVIARKSNRAIILKMASPRPKVRGKKKQFIPFLGLIRVVAFKIAYANPRYGRRARVDGGAGRGRTIFGSYL